MASSRPIKTWWAVCCIRCGKRFPTARRHAETCSPTCRQRCHRSGYARYEPDPRILGTGRTPPQFDPNTWAEVPRGGLVAELPAARTVEVEFDDGTVCTASEQQFEEMCRIVEAEARAEEVLQYVWASALPSETVQAFVLLKIDTFAPLPPREVVRKRVWNLLSRKTLSEGQKRIIREAWHTVQSVVND